MVIFETYYKTMKQLTMLLSIFSMMNFASAQDGELTSFYDLKSKTIEGKEYDFSQLKGKKVLIINTASKCGFTPQYEQLEELHDKYGAGNFVILGFPCNQFGSQEPGTNDEIGAFCQKNYGVSFQMMDKVDVKGDNTDLVYQWLTNKNINGVKSTSVKWNFQKYLVNESGVWVDTYASMTKPNDKDIIEWIESKK
jgi:glutathione peroxidase